MRALALALTLVAGVATAGGKLMFPLPAGAKSPAHVVLSPGVGEQDYFWLETPYPATPALSHYASLFGNWIECKPWRTGWRGFGDASNGANRYVHDFSRNWITRTNDRAVTLLFKYESKGLGYRERPDNDNQFVAVISYRVPDAAAFFAKVQIDCPKAPNSRLEDDAIVPALRASARAPQPER